MVSAVTQVPTPKETPATTASEWLVFDPMPAKKDAAANGSFSMARRLPS